MKTIKVYELKKLQSDFPKQKITNSEAAAKFIRMFYGDDIEVFESMFILLLNIANDTIGYAKISQGGIAGTYVDVKLIAKYSIDSLAEGVILAHNHPSGNLNHSMQDIEVSKKVKEALKILDVTLLDSLIITKERHTSLADEGLI